MKSYIDELWAALIGIIFSPMLLYILIRYKTGDRSKQTAAFRAEYAETLLKPKTIYVHYSDFTIYLTCAGLIAAGFVTDEWIFDYLAAIIAFALGVGGLWMMEVGKKAGL